MESTTMYQVQKFLPARCPKCKHAFRSRSDYTNWLGEGTSYAEAAWNQFESFPEIYQKNEDSGTTPEITVSGYTNRFGIDFIMCSTCQNVTMRIDYGMRQVGTLAEAELLVEQQGFIGLQEVTAQGNMAQPYAHLAWLGQIDLQMSQGAEAQQRDNQPYNATTGAGMLFVMHDPAPTLTTTAPENRDE